MEAPRISYELCTPFLLTLHSTSYDNHIESIESIATREKITADSGSKWEYLKQGGNVYRTEDKTEVLILSYDGTYCRYALIAEPDRGRGA